MASTERKIRDPFESVGSIIQELLKKSEFIPPSLKQELTVLDAWDKAAGNEISRQTKAQHFKNGILFIETQSAVWARELQWKSATIRKKMNSILQQDLVKEIQFRMKKF